MTCPGCTQQFQKTGEQGQCPYCGYPCAEYQRQVTSTQIVLGAFFASTLVYAGLVAFWELVARHGPAVAASLAGVFGAALIVLSLGVLVASVVIERAMLARDDPHSVRKAALVLAATAEVPTMLGLVIYLLTGSLQWFVASVAISWALFIRLGVRLPVYLHRISEYLRLDRPSL